MTNFKKPTALQGFVIKSSWLLILTMGFTFSGFSQVHNTIELHGGLSHRNASIELTDYYFRTHHSKGIDFDWVYMSRDQNISLDIRRNVFSRNLYAQVSGYMRYGHLYYDSTGVELKRFKYDVFVDALYIFRKKGNESKNKLFFIAGLGVGYMNLNTGYSHNKFLYDSSLVMWKNGFYFFAPRLLVGAAYKKLNAFIILHGTPDTHYDPNPTLWLEFKASYKFLSITSKKK